MLETSDRNICMDPGQKYATCSEKIHRVQKRKLELYYDRQLEKENGLNDRLMKMDAINSRKIEKERHANRRREANIKQFDSRNLNGVEVSIPQSVYGATTLTTKSFYRQRKQYHHLQTETGDSRQKVTEHSSIAARIHEAQKRRKQSQKREQQQFDRKHLHQWRQYETYLHQKHGRSATSSSKKRPDHLYQAHKDKTDWFRLFMQEILGAGCKQCKEGKEFSELVYQKVLQKKNTAKDYTRNVNPHSSIVENIRKHSQFGLTAHNTARKSQSTLNRLLVYVRNTIHQVPEFLAGLQKQLVSDCNRQ